MPKTSLRAALVAAFAASSLALTACSGAATTPEPTVAPTEISTADATQTPAETPTPTPHPTPTAVSDNLDAIAVTGEPLTPPTVTVPSPWGIDETRTKVLNEGTGPVVGPDATVDVYYQGVNGSTGTVFNEQYTAGKTASFPLDGVVPGFKKGLEGQKVGSRVLIAMPGSDGYDAGGGQPSVGIEVGDTLIFVVDIVAASLSGPDGEAQPQDPTMPQVGGEPNAPVVTFPDGWTAPTDTVSTVLIQGTGADVTEADTVLVNYQTISAATKEVVEQSYGDKPVSAPLAQMIDGFKKGVAGHKVGSRVLIVVPAKDAYSEQGNPPSIPANDTLVFVVDILKVTPGQ